jgi:hypothetical protein
MTPERCAAPSAFTRIASAPACSLSRSSCSELSRVKSTTERDGASLFISRVASNPFITGIRKSMTAKSGKHSRAFCTASNPFAASAHTSISLMKGRFDCHRDCCFQPSDWYPGSPQGIKRGTSSDHHTSTRPASVSSVASRTTAELISSNGVNRDGTPPSKRCSGLSEST